MSGNGLDAHVLVRRDAFTLDARILARAGELVAVMGPSGAGKSTLLAVIAGLERAPDSVVQVAGREVSSPRVHVPPQRRGVVLLGQDPRLFPHLSARDNVAFGLQARRVGRAQARTEAEEWLERMGLGGRGQSAPRELSGGQRQRVALARALATRPGLLLLDEPLTGLDPETAAGIREILSEQLAATTTLLVTHNVVDAAALASRLVMLENGSVTQSGPVREVLTRPATPFAATISGISRVPGVVADGRWRAGTLSLPAGDCPAGRAVAFFPPGALHPLASEPDPAALPWRARIRRLDATVSGVRAVTADPEIGVDLPAAALAGHDLAPGGLLLLGVDRSAVRIEPG